MSGPHVRLESVLARHARPTYELTAMNADELKRAARFWFGTTAGNKMRKDECIDALTKALGDHKRLEERVRALSDKERQILSVVRRYGGAVSGNLLRVELLARGLIHDEEPAPGQAYRYRNPNDDPVARLRHRLLLVDLDDPVSWSDYVYGYSSRPSYPALALLPGLAPLVENAPPLSWDGSRAGGAPGVPWIRPIAAVVLDFWALANCLARMETWQTNRGGTPTKSVRGKLARELPTDTGNPTPLPDVAGLHYEILRALGVVTVADGEGRIDLKVLERRLEEPAVVQGWSWVRAWLDMALWQDGIGIVPDRDQSSDLVRIRPSNLRAARERLAWALARVAGSAPGWLDLEAFLGDLWLAGDDSLHSLYWDAYLWTPAFATESTSRRRTDRENWQRQIGMKTEGAWAANALFGTLAHLGLVEHGEWTVRSQSRPCFRLTAVGRVVFGAPDMDAPEPSYEPKFLTVQPNHEIQAYLDDADPRAVGMLARMARRVSATGERVQTFALTRESVYLALESGLTTTGMTGFLTSHGKTPLPELVAHSLAEWSRRREAIAVSTGVVLGVSPPGGGGPFDRVVMARPLSDGFVVLPGTPTRGKKHVVVRDHLDFRRPAWKVDDEFRVRVTDDADSVCLARLGQFATPHGDDWVIDAASVRRAREHGIPPEQILGWLKDHLDHPVPPVLETAVRNWGNPTEVFLGELVVLQVSQPQAYAMIVESPRFRPLLHLAVPPHWFFVRTEKRAELERLLAGLGFAVGATWKPTAPVTKGGSGGADSRKPPRKRGRPRRRS